jgi:hypothetical protein
MLSGNGDSSSLNTAAAVEGLIAADGKAKFRFLFEGVAFFGGGVFFTGDRPIALFGDGVFFGDDGAGFAEDGATALFGDGAGSLPVAPDSKTTEAEKK